MRSPRFVTVLLLLALMALAGSAWAVGPLDGSYQTTVTFPDSESFTLYVVVIQNDSLQPNLGVAFLDPFGLWTYGFGTLDAQNHVTGPILDPFDGTELGQFDFLFQNGFVSGTLTQFGEVLALSGPRFF